MRYFPVLLCTAALALSACAPPPETVGLEAAGTSSVAGAGGGSAGTAQRAPVSDGSCNAELYKDLIGEPISVLDSLALGPNLRILPADSFVTRDFDPNRLTFTTTRKDTVGRVFCG